MGFGIGKVAVTQTAARDVTDTHNKTSVNGYSMFSFRDWFLPSSNALFARFFVSRETFNKNFAVFTCKVLKFAVKSCGYNFMF